MRFWSVFLSYIILIGFANCILYGGHRLAFWRGAEHRDYWPQNIQLCFAFSCFDALEVGIWTRLLKKSLFVFYTIFAIFKPYHRRIVYFWRRFIIVMLALIFGLFLAILESKILLPTFSCGSCWCIDGVMKFNLCFSTNCLCFKSVWNHHASLYSGTVDPK